MIALALLVAATQPAQLSPVHAQLYYQETGRLSDDVLNRPKPFIFWNAIIGEGDADEIADDLLISVQLIGDKFGGPERNQKIVDDPVTLTATDQKGKVVGSRTFRHVLLSTKGTATLPLWLNDVTCESIKIKATFRDQVETAHLKMACGE
jgi:hypothetical protein